MEILKTHKLKTVKQLIELDLQGKIKLDIYKSLYNTYLNNRRIFDLLIITYYKSIDFNKKVHKNTVLEQMIDIKSKYLNFILIHVKIHELYYITYMSYKSFKILLNNLNKNGFLIFLGTTIFTILLNNKSLKFIKFFINLCFSNKKLIKDIIEFLILKNSDNISLLDHACSNKLNKVKYLFKFIESFNLKLINSIISIEMLIFARKDESVFKYLLKNHNFNLTDLDNEGNSITHYVKDLNTIKLLIKYDGNINLEINRFIKKYNIFRFLIKYTKPNNVIFENSEIHKFIYFKKR